MEQLNFIKQKLQIRDFPQITTRQYGKIKAPEIIIACFILSFLFNILGFYSLTYLLLGFAIPGVLNYKDIKTFNYWECLSMLLFLRYFTDAFQTLDGIFLILLWHPNFKFAQKFIQWLKSYKQKGHIEKGVTQLKKFL